MTPDMTLSEAGNGPEPKAYSSALNAEPFHLKTSLGRWLCLAPMMAVVIALSGCVGIPKDLDAYGARALIKPSDLIDVALADADRTRVDHIGIGEMIGTQPSYITGPQWARIFVGRVGKTPLFTIRQATVHFDQIALGFAGRVRYDVEGTLTYGDRDWPISVEGKKSVWFSDNTVVVAAAVHEGIVKAAAACRAIIGRGTEGR